MATRCITANGTGSGADWTSPGPISLISGSANAGDICYLAGGSYGSQNFSRAGIAASPITIRRATVADHGPSAGWVNTMDTQVVFNGLLTLATNIVLDGNKWTPPGLPTSYGILINMPLSPNSSTTNRGIDMRNGSSVVRNVEVAGNGFLTSNFEADCIEFGSNSTLSGCKLHDTDTLIHNFGPGLSNCLIEYCTLYNVGSTDSSSNVGNGPHPDVWYNGDGFTNGVFRYNVVANAISEGCFIDFQHPGTTGAGGSGMVYYGNLMFQGASQGGGCVPIEFTNTNNPGFGNIYIFNNTFVDWTKSNNRTQSCTIGTGSTITNNLFANCDNEWTTNNPAGQPSTPTGRGTQDTNGFYGGFPVRGTNTFTSSTNPFVTSVGVNPPPNYWTLTGTSAPVTKVVPDGTPGPVGYDPTPYISAFTLAPGSWAAGKASTAAIPAGMQAVATALGITINPNVDMFGNTSATPNLGAFQPAGAVAPAVPALTQLVSTASNTRPIDLNGVEGNPGNPFFISLPNVSGANNALIIQFSFENKGFSSPPNTAPGNTAPNPTVAVTITGVTDDKGNVWNQAGSTVTGSAVTSNGTQISSAQFVAFNVAAGTVKITVTFNCLIYSFQAVVQEWQNVGSVNATGSSTTTSNPITNSLTTTAPGCLILNYGRINTNPSNTLTSLTQGSGFTLECADVFLGTFCQYQIQAAAGSITSSVTPLTTLSDIWNSISMALAPAPVGSPPPVGIRISKRIHQLINRASQAAQFPCGGNLILMNTAFPTSISPISGVTDSSSNTWVQKTVASFPQIWFAANASTSGSLKVTPAGVNFTANMTTVIFYDVFNAATAPFDTVAGVQTQAVNNMNNTPITCPTISPSTSGGLVFAVMGNTFGPSTGLTNPSQLFDTVTYTNQKDNDNMDNGDGYGHYYNTAAGSMSFTWSMNSVITAELSSALAVAFKSSTGGTGPTPVNATVHIR